METRKSTVVLAALNAKFIHSSLSVWYLAAAIKQYSAELSPIAFEATIHEKTSALADKIMAHGSFAVCFSCYIWNIEKAVELAAEIKKVSPQTHIIFGGPEAEFQSEALLRKYNFLTAVSLGEGEESLPALLSAVKNGLPLTGLSGAAFLIGDNYYKNAPKPLSAQPPSPYTPDYFTALGGRMAYLETSRGCPYSCAFCLSGCIGAPKWFDIELAKQNILTLAKSGAKTIKLIDRTFNARAAHANEIWRFIADNYGTEIPYGTRFHFEIAADILTHESIEILNNMPRGAVQLEAGIQSVNEETLAAVCRKTDTEAVLAKLSALLKPKNLHLHVDLIAGLPHEGLQSFINGFNRVYALKADMLQLGFLKLLHGSRMREMPESYPCEYSPKPPYEIISTPWLSARDMDIIRNAEDALERLYNSGRFLNTVNYALESTGLSAFELFAAVGRAQAGTSLSDYVQLLQTRLALIKGISKAVLRDKTALDWLCFNSTGRLPPALCVADARLKQAVKALIKSERHALPKGVKRGVAMLYTESSVVYVDYIGKNEITGQYSPHFVPFEELEIY